MGKIKRLLSVISLMVIFSFGFSGVTTAACIQGQQSCSNTFGVGQVFFGNGGSLDNICSNSYCAKQSVGEIGVGNPSSNTYQAHAGFNVDREPYLEFKVTATNVDLGLLQTTSTATGTASFSVKDYLSSGYNIITASPSPAYGSHNLASPSSPLASAVGTEQFGINLVANTTACGAPANFGSNPIQVPSAAYSYGSAAPGYNTCGKFQYIPNSVIANSSQSSGETDFTISYIANISKVTPAGYYKMDQTLVATGTY